MGLFKRCSHRISPSQLEVIGKMYPYDILCYNDLRPHLVSFLADAFPDADGETKIIDISEHNGRGRQWGIVLLQFPGRDDWELVGHFGHRPWLRPIWKKLVDFDYSFLIYFGRTPKSRPGPDHNYHFQNIRRLKEIPAFCEWIFVAAKRAE